jgi:hypothetical protein
MHGLVHRTPLMRAAAIGAQAGVELFLKCENLQKTGSFKPRGQINKIAHLTAAEKERGIITDKDVAEIEAQVKAEVDRAVEFADKSPLPDPQELYTDVYATPINPNE